MVIFVMVEVNRNRGCLCGDFCFYGGDFSFSGIDFAFFEVDFSFFGGDFVFTVVILIFWDYF